MTEALDQSSVLVLLISSLSAIAGSVLTTIVNAVADNKRQKVIKEIEELKEGRSILFLKRIDVFSEYLEHYAAMLAINTFEEKIARARKMRGFILRMKLLLPYKTFHEQIEKLNIVTNQFVSLLLQHAPKFKDTDSCKNKVPEYATILNELKESSAKLEKSVNMLVHQVG